MGGNSICRDIMLVSEYCSIPFVVSISRIVIDGKVVYRANYIQNGCLIFKFPSNPIYKWGRLLVDLR